MKNMKNMFEFLKRHTLICNTLSGHRVLFKTWLVMGSSHGSWSAIGVHHNVWSAMPGLGVLGWPLAGFSQSCLCGLASNPFSISFLSDLEVYTDTLWPEPRKSYCKVSPFDPHIAKLATMGMVAIVEEATHPLDGRDPEVGQAEVHMGYHGVESSTGSPKQPLNRLGQPSVVGVDHVLTKEAELLGRGEALTNSEALIKQKQDMIFGLKRILNTMTQENNALDADVSRLEAELKRSNEELKLSKEELKLVLDGQQAMRKEYDGLSLEIKLCNPKVDLSYMGYSFLESTLAQGKELYESRMETN
uniref:Uncharacterized protein n=1 Tax=Cannabis sativa TaxID=3483 RepID=A0A803QGH4_CANSA